LCVLHSFLLRSSWDHVATLCSRRAHGGWMRLMGFGQRCSVLASAVVAALFDGIVACWVLATLAVWVGAQTPVMLLLQRHQTTASRESSRPIVCNQRSHTGTCGSVRSFAGCRESAKVRELSISFVDKDDADPSASPANTHQPSLSQSGARCSLRLRPGHAASRAAR